jgi:gliding motility-associated-like protein
LKRLLPFLVFSLIFVSIQGQTLVDPCFFSVPASSGFSNSADIANEPAGGADMVKYENGSWSNAASGSGLSIEPPVNCDAVKAIFLRSQGANAEGVGFRLATPLNNGGAYFLNFTYVSHGNGSTGTFSPKVYACNTPNLFVGGVLQGTLLGSLNPAGTTWLTGNFNFNGSPGVAGATWIFIYADNGSGLIMNNCQMAAGELSIDLPNITEICQGETATLGDPSLANATSIIWNTGAASATINATVTGYYAVSASNSCNSVSDATNVIVYTEPDLFPDGDTTLCQGSSIELRTVGFNPVATWPDGSNDSLFFVTAPGLYQVMITDECATIQREVNVLLDSIPVIRLGADTALCFNEPLTLNAFINWPASTYQWSTGETTPEIAVTLNESAVYSVNATNLCGTGSDAIYVEYSLIPTDILAGSYEICFGRQLILNTAGIEGKYEWRDGSTDSTFPVPSEGWYWVTIEDDDDCWVISDTTIVIEIPCTCPMFLPNSFTPNDDGLNDEFRPVFTCEPYDYQLDLYNRWGVKIQTILDPTIGWNGKSAGDPLEDGIYAFRLFYREVYDGIPIIKFGHVVLLHHDE